ncbi:hypothetical protein ACQRIT_005722 [Beauveria bassiana]
MNRISLTHTDQLAESQTLAFNSLRFLGASSNVPTALSAASVSLTSSWTRATRPDPAALDSQDSLPRRSICCGFLQLDASLTCRFSNALPYLASSSVHITDLYPLSLDISHHLLLHVVLHQAMVPRARLCQI